MSSSPRARTPNQAAWSWLPGAAWLKGRLLALGFRPRSAVIFIPYAWLLLFFVVPFIIVLKISLAVATIAQPPFTPLFTPEGKIELHLNSYKYLFTDSLYVDAYLSSLKIAFVSTLICLVVGYPMAYGIARAHPSRRNILLMLIVLPFWTSLLIRVYAWMGILNASGVINGVLLWLGIIQEPIGMMRTTFAVYVGIIYSYLPFMLLPLYANLEKMDLTLLEAATDLGCRPLKAFFLITVPLSFPGIVAGCMLVFIPAVGEYVIPELLGGSDTLMIGKTLVNEFFTNRDWPVASAVAMAVLLVLVVPLGVLQYYQNKQAEAAS